MKFVLVLFGFLRLKVKFKFFHASFSLFYNLAGCHYASNWVFAKSVKISRPHAFRRAKNARAKKGFNVTAKEIKVAKRTMSDVALPTEKKNRQNLDCH